MAAIYHYNETDEIFKCGIKVLNSVKLEFLKELLTDKNQTIITELSIQAAETVQFFLTFDDVINWFYFGKGLGTMTIQGLILTGDEGSPGLSTFLNVSMKEMRGKTVQASVGNAIFYGVLTNFSLNLTQDPSPIIAFTLSFAVVDHNLPGNLQNTPNCSYDPSKITYGPNGTILA